MSHGSLEEDLIACNMAVAYAVEPKGTGTQLLYIGTLLPVRMDHT